MKSLVLAFILLTVSIGGATPSARQQLDRDFASYFFRVHGVRSLSLNSFFQPKDRSEPLGRNEQRVLEAALMERALGLSSDTDAADLIRNGRDFKGAHFPSLREMAGAAEPLTALRLLEKASLVGPRSANAAYQVLKSGHSRSTISDLVLKIAVAIGDDGDRLEIVEKGFATLYRLANAADADDASADFIRHVFIGGVLKGKANRDGSRGDAFADNLEVVFRTMPEDDQLYLASRLPEVHAEHAYALMESLLASPDQRLARLALSGLLVSRDDQAPGWALRLMKKHEFDSDPHLIKELALRIDRDSDRPGVVGENAKKLIFEMIRHENPLMRAWGVFAMGDSRAIPNSLVMDLLGPFLRDPDAEVRRLSLDFIVTQNMDVPDSLMKKVRSLTKDKSPLVASLAQEIVLRGPHVNSKADRKSCEGLFN